MLCISHINWLVLMSIKYIHGCNAIKTYYTGHMLTDSPHEY